MRLRLFDLDSQAYAVFFRLMKYSLRYWPVFMLAVLGMIVYAGTQVSFAVLMKELLDEAIVARNREAIAAMPKLILLLFIMRGISEFSSTYSMGWIGRKVINTMRSELFAHYLRLPTAYYDRHSSGVLLSKLTYNIEQVAESNTTVVKTIIQDTFTIVGLVTYMFIISPLLTVLALIAGPVVALLVRYLSRVFRRYSSRIQNSMGDVTSVTEEAIGAHRVIKVFNGQEHERQQFESVNEKNRRLHMKLVTARATSVPVIQLIAAVGVATVVYVATSDTMLDAITAGAFASFLTAMVTMMQPLKSLTNINVNLQRGIAAGQSVFELLDEPLEDAGGDKRVDRVRGDVEFRDVGFAYAKEKGSVLRNISFRIRAGQTVAIVGRSGSGKSTLVSLLPRFYDPETGEILLDGVGIKSYQLEDLRNQVSLVSQDVTLFNDTIAHNIAYGALGSCSKEQIEQAAKAAHVWEFASTLPDGLDTIVGDRGTLLSGGQRQRIAIARALLKNAPVLILDEATSALDTESERHIQQALTELMLDRTTLVIAHRLSTVENADRIIVLQQGEIIEQGDHSDLLTAGGQYATLHKMQFREPVRAVSS